MTYHPDWESRIGSLERIAIDTNAIIYLFEGLQPYADMVRSVVKRVESGDAVAVISTIVEMELLVGPLKAGNFDLVDRLTLFLRHERNLVIREVDSLVASTAAAMRARSRLGTPDALIAATASAERCDAIIGNDYDFARRSSEVPYLRLDDYLR